jgi:histidine triad (HIT) family protein
MGVIMSQFKCVFCEIIEGKEDAYRIMEDELSMVILDIQPYTNGHCLIIPKRHVKWWHEMTDDEITSLFKLAKKAAKKLMVALKPDFVSLTTRGRHIPHAHIHLIPTHGGDVIDSFYNAIEKFQESTGSIAKLRNEEVLIEAAGAIRNAIISDK